MTPEREHPNLEENTPPAEEVREHNGRTSDDGDEQLEAVDGRPDDDAARPADAAPLDESGEPASGFVASDPKPAAPEQATEAEPFADVVGHEVTGPKVDPFAELSDKDQRKHDARIKSVRDAQRSGEELAMSPRRSRAR